MRKVNLQQSNYMAFYIRWPLDFEFLTVAVGSSHSNAYAIAIHTGTNEHMVLDMVKTTLKCLSLFKNTHIYAPQTKLLVMTTLGIICSCVFVQS